MWKRVIAPTALVSLLWIVVSLVTTYHINWMFESNSRTISENVTTIESAWAMRRDTWKLQVAILETSYANREQMQQAVTELEGSFLNALSDAEKTSFTPQEQQLIRTIRDRFGVYRAHIQQQIQTRSADPVHLPSPAEREQAISLASAVSESCRSLSELNEQLIGDSTSQSRQLHSTLVMMRIGFMVVGPLVGLFLGLLVARRLNRSISEISITLKHASGELDSDLGSVAVSMSDDLPALQRQVHIFADRIQEVVTRVNEARQRAMQSERLAAVGELAAGVAHEIRNPLTSVKLLIQTAAQRRGGGGLNETQSRIILEEIGRMENMIQELLDFARPPRLRVVQHDLRQTLKRALNLIEGRAKQHHVRIVEQLPQTPLLISGDPEQLHLVFVNLAINGVEAMSGGGTLTVSAECDDSTCRITFADTGPGIASDLINRLFDPFVTNKERGTGLGLAISRRIVLEHHGKLSAENEKDRGAIFTVELKRGEIPTGGENIEPLSLSTALS